MSAAAVFIHMHEGVILAVKDAGYGFVGEAGEPDLFFHCNDCIDLEWGEQLVGQRVTYEITSTPKGLRARNVRPAT